MHNDTSCSSKSNSKWQDFKKNLSFSNRVQSCIHTVDFNNLSHDSVYITIRGVHTRNVIQKKCSNLIQTQQIFLIYYIRLSLSHGVYQSGLIWQEKNDQVPSANRVICQDPSETSFPHPINYTCPKPAEILQGTKHFALPWALISWMSPCHGLFEYFFQDFYVFCAAILCHFGCF